MQHRAYSILEVKAVKEDERIIEGVATTPTTDRAGDIVEPLGVQFKNPMPLLWQHQSDKPVGEVRFGKPTKAGIPFKASLPVPTISEALKERVNEAWESVKLKLVRGVSIGFRSIERAYIEGGGIRFIQSEVMELSLVTIPANAEATITSIKKFDAAQRAATGYMLKASTTPPGVSGPNASRDNGVGTMKTTEQLIRELEDDRATKAARIEEIAPDDAGTFTDDATKAEYRTLVKDVREIDEKVSDLEGILLARKTAKPIVAKDTKSGAAARKPALIQVKELPKGTAFARYAMAIAAGKGSFSDTLEYAKRWDSQTPEVSAYIKATVGSVGNSTWGDELAEPQTLVSDFIELLMPRTVLGRISGFDMVPFNVRILEQTSGSSVNWVGEAAAKPVGSPAFDEFTLGINKMAGIVVISDELVRVAVPNVEEKVRNDLIKQIVKFMDVQFLTKTVTAQTYRPAAVTVGAQAVGASDTDIEAFWADFNGAMAPFDESEIDTASMHIVMTPSIARRLSSLRNTLGQSELPTLTPLGGTIQGYPVIVSSSSPSGQITFVVASEIAMADDGSVRLDASREATLDMAGGDTPAFNLWQKNAVAIRAERWITYKKKRANAVTMIENAAYGEETNATV